MHESGMYKIHLCHKFTLIVKVELPDWMHVTPSLSLIQEAWRAKQLAYSMHEGSFSEC